MIIRSAALFACFFLLNQGPAFLSELKSLSSWHCSCPAPLVHVWTHYGADSRVSSTRVRADSNRTVFGGLWWRLPLPLFGRACIKRAEYFSAVWRVGVYRRVFLPPLTTAFVTAEPLPALFWFVSTPTIITELHTFLSTVI